MQLVKLSKLFAIFLICTLLCGMSASAEDAIPVESIKISIENEMMIRETQRIKVSVLPANAQEYELEYLSSDTAVMTAAIGTVIANSEGKAELTVRVKNTEIADSVTVTVRKSKDILVSDIDLYDEEIYLERYAEKRIIYDIIPSNAINQKVKFTSMNTSVATVTDEGVVYGRRNGSTKIKVESEDGNASKYVYVTVSDRYDNNFDESDIAVRRIDIYDGENEVKKEVKLMRTQKKQFTVQIYPESATDKRIRWKSEDSDIAEVDENGIVTGIREGKVKIYAISRDNDRQDYISVNIIPYVCYPTAISITSLQNAIYETGQTIKFTPTFQPEDTTERNVRWVVSGGCAIVDNQGNVTITDKGVVTVKAYSYDWKVSASFEFQSSYSANHFQQMGTAYNVKQTRAIILTFDSDVNINSAKNSVFACTDKTANGERTEINIEVAGNKLIITPSLSWVVGDNYIFIKETLCDIYGNKLGKNIKYTMKVRGTNNAKA